MTEPFIPRHSRPRVAASLARDAWAVAAVLEGIGTGAEPADEGLDAYDPELEPAGGDQAAGPAGPELRRRRIAARPDLLLQPPPRFGPNRREGDALLVLAQPYDETARRFVAFAEERGIHCLMPRLASEPELSVEVERDGSATVEIRAGDGWTRVRGVLNRGLPRVEGPSEGEQFRSAETLASWWAALALFPGPVINRPSGMAFIPDLSISPLVRDAAGIRAAPAQIGSEPPRLPAEPRVNIHRLRTGEYLGYLSAAGDSRGIVDDEILVYTGFDPAQTLHILLAGSQTFNLSSDLGYLSPPLERRLAPLTERLRALDARFSLLVVQPGIDIIRVVHATPFPSIRQYERIAAAVHEALLEALLR